MFPHVQLMLWLCFPFCMKNNIINHKCRSNYLSLNEHRFDTCKLRTHDFQELQATFSCFLLVVSFTFCFISKCKVAFLSLKTSLFHRLQKVILNIGFGYFFFYFVFTCGWSRTIKTNLFTLLIHWSSETFCVAVQNHYCTTVVNSWDWFKLFPVSF